MESAPTPPAHRSRPSTRCKGGRRRPVPFRKGGHSPGRLLVKRRTHPSGASSGVNPLASVLTPRPRRTSGLQPPGVRQLQWRSPSSRPLQGTVETPPVSPIHETKESQRSKEGGRRMAEHREELERVGSDATKAGYTPRPKCDHRSSPCDDSTCAGVKGCRGVRVQG